MDLADVDTVESGQAHHRGHRCAGDHRGAAANFTFIVAFALQQASDDCGVGQYSQLTQPGFGKLCIVPNFAADACYSVPSATGTLVDFRAAPCDTPVNDRAQMIRVQGRAAAPTIDCPGGQIVSFAEPSRVRSATA